jgi:hypothetical protein
MVTLDGIGLAPETLPLIAEHGGVVHARVGERLKPRRAACDNLGGWWSGIAAEVTCRVCLDVLDEDEKERHVRNAEG